MSVATIREVRSTARPRHALATRPTSQKSRYNFPVTITDKSGRVRVVSGDTIRPKRGRKGRKRKAKQVKATYRLSEQVSRGVSGSFDSEVMRKIGTIHAEH